MVNILFDLVKIKLSTAILGDVLDLIPPQPVPCSSRSRPFAPGTMLDGRAIPVRFWMASYAIAAGSASLAFRTFSRRRYAQDQGVRAGT